MKKVEVNCLSCDAGYFVTHDLLYPYELSFCPFCGDPIAEDDDVEEDDFIEDIEDDDIEDW